MTTGYSGYTEYAGCSGCAGCHGLVNTLGYRSLVKRKRPCTLTRARHLCNNNMRPLRRGVMHMMSLCRFGVVSLCRFGVVSCTASAWCHVPLQTTHGMVPVNMHINKRFRNQRWRKVDRQHATDSMQHATDSMQHATDCMQHATDCMQHATHTTNEQQMRHHATPRSIQRHARLQAHLPRARSSAARV